MSYTHCTGVANARARIEYILVGKGEMKRAHRANGTDRVAAMTCTTGDVETFLERAESMTSRGRKLQAYSYIQSFKNTEFDPTNRYDVQRVNDLGYQLATELNPDADHLVVTHTDGKGPGGCGPHPHNHILTVNDDGHGSSIQRGKLHSHVRAVNDKLMRQNGLEVIPLEHSKERTTEDQATYWAEVRGMLGSFDTYLGDLVAEARNAAIGQGIAVFRAELATRGVSLATAEEGGEERWTYRARDPEAPNKRLRRRKASKLAPDLDAATVSLMVAPLTPKSPPTAAPVADVPTQAAPVRLGPSLEMYAPKPHTTTAHTPTRPLGQDAEGVAAAAKTGEAWVPTFPSRRRRKTKEELEKELEKLPPLRRQHVLRSRSRRKGLGGPSL